MTLKSPDLVTTANYDAQVTMTESATTGDVALETDPEQK